MATAPSTAIPDPTTDKPPHPKRWIPISLRIFVVILSLLGAASALWIGVPAYRQHVAIQEIGRLGGHIQTEERVPAWLRQWLGPETLRRFDSVHTVKLGGREVTDEMLHDFECLGDLERLDLSRTRVTDEGLKSLKTLKNLDWLNLDQTQITDDGLEHLKGLANLRILELSKTKVSDRGLVHLTGLTQLKYLYLNGTNVTDAGLGHLKGLTNLELLWLTSVDRNDTHVTAAAVEELKAALPILEIDAR
jgi:hypothetical protein